MRGRLRATDVLEQLTAFLTGSAAAAAGALVARLRLRPEAPTGYVEDGTNSRRLELRSDLLALQRTRGGAFEDGPVDVESGAVTGTVPAALRAVKAQQAAEMGTTQGDGVKAPVIGPKHACLSEAVPQHPRVPGW